MSAIAKTTEVLVQCPDCGHEQHEAAADFCKANFDDGVYNTECESCNEEFEFLVKG